MNKDRALDTAKALITGPREAAYSPPSENFADIAALWAAYKGVPFTPADVAVMSALIKVARIKASPARADHWIDIAGYAACGAEVAGAK